MTASQRTTIGIGTVLALVAALLVVVASPANAATATVTNGNDSGAGSFRDAVDQANGDPTIDTIRFDPGLNVKLDDAVVYEGAQSLKIDGRGSTVRSSAAAMPATDWGTGLFVSNGGADLELKRLRFLDSFGSGVVVLVPGTQTGTQTTVVNDVDIRRAQFHGLFVDDQASTGFNTDGEPHPGCTDPHFVESSATVNVDIRNSVFNDNGMLDPGFDTSLATGCPQDFDGVRIDEGAAGDLTASMNNVDAKRNLADGTEYDEKGEGSVLADTRNSSFDRNGETLPISDGAGGTVEDLDDGFDIDEEGPGGIVATIHNSTANSNFDEGFDIDADGEGDVDLTVANSQAKKNEDEGLKVSVVDGGNLIAEVRNSTFTGSLSDYGVTFETEEDDGTEVGTIDAVIKNSTIKNNDDGIIEAVVEGEDTGTVVLQGGNLKGSIETENVIIDLA